MECKDFLNAVSKIPQNTFDGIIASLVLKKFDFGNGYVPSESSIAVFSSNSQDDLKNSVSGAMLSSLGMNYISEDNLLTAARNLRTQLGTSFETDFAASKIVYQPATKTYKLKMLVGDDTWAAARSWVAQEYDPGDVTSDSIHDVDFTAFSPNQYYVLFNSDQSVLPDNYVLFNGDQSVLPVTCTGKYQDRYPSGGYVSFSLSGGHLIENIDVGYGLDTRDLGECISLEVDRSPSGGLRFWYLIQGQTTRGVRTWDCPVEFKISSSVHLGTASSDIVDNPTYDYSNARSGAREIAVGLTPAATLTANIIIDGVHGFSVSNEENTILLTKTAQDIISEDMSGTVLSISAQS